MVKNDKSTYNIMKFICKLVKYTALGDYWHECSGEHIVQRIVTWTIIYLYIILIILEAFEVILYDHPFELNNDAKSFCVGHIIVISRMLILQYYKKDIRQIISDMIDACKSYESDKTLSKQYRKMMFAFGFQLFTIFMTMALYGAEAIRRTHADGTPFIVIVTYWPKYEDISVLAVSMRLATLTIHMMHMCAMLATDTFIIGHLICLSYKFNSLRLYFDKLCDDFNMNKNKKDALYMFKADCLKGLEMHRELIRLSKVIFHTFGIAISIHVCQSSLMIISILLRLTLSSDLTLLVIFMNITFLSAIGTQLALYTWNSGEITYQASLMSNAVFHCGWYMCDVERPFHRDVRRLILMGCAQALRPITIKAFGVHDLSYGTFVNVVRTSYSLFAILH